MLQFRALSHEALVLHPHSFFRAAATCWPIPQELQHSNPFSFKFVNGDIRLLILPPSPAIAYFPFILPQFWSQRNFSDLYPSDIGSFRRRGTLEEETYRKSNLKMKAWAGKDGKEPPTSLSKESDSQEDSGTPAGWVPAQLPPLSWSPVHGACGERREER